MIRAREDDEKMKAMTPKEREEYKRLGTRLSGQHRSMRICDVLLIVMSLGRQLFERNRDLDIADDNLLEEDTVSVDVSQYEREVVVEEEEEEEEESQVTFSDSDSE